MAAATKERKEPTPEQAARYKAWGEEMKQRWAEKAAATAPAADDDAGEIAILHETPKPLTADAFADPRVVALQEELIRLRAQLEATTAPAVEIKEPEPDPREKLLEQVKAAKARQQERMAETDPDREVAEEVARVLGTAQPPPPPRQTAYVEDDDPNHLAELMALKILEEARAKAAAQEKKRVLDPRLDHDKERARGRTPIELMIDAPEEVNPFAFEDETTGEDLREPGYVYRWTRLKDDFGQRRDNPIRLRQRMAWGAEIVTQRDGKQLRTDTMIATRLPIKREAQRKIAIANAGTYDNARTLAAREHDRLSQVADDENVAYSKRYHGGAKGVVHLDPAPQSGSWYGRADEGDDE